MRIFYFNITYGCNSNCVFCYSHNTLHDSISHNEIKLTDFKTYLIEKKIDRNDKIIINGGEPFLHTRIEELLDIASSRGCEVLVYTNGRLLSQYDFSKYGKQFRFIIPIHGYEQLHDTVTGRKGSYRETILGAESACARKNLVDIKIIINGQMIQCEENFKATMESLDNLRVNHAIHITKMADTLVSRKNGCKTITNIQAALYTRLLYEWALTTGLAIKIYDTCVSDIIGLTGTEKCILAKPEKVYFKDYNQEREIAIGKKTMSCQVGCKSKEYCISAVSEYKVLELFKETIYESVE